MNFVPNYGLTNFCHGTLPVSKCDINYDSVGVVLIAPGGYAAHLASAIHSGQPLPLLIASDM